MSDPFAGVHQKIARSAEHFAAFEAETDAWVAQGRMPYELETKQESDASGTVWNVTRIASVNELPDRWGLIVGDALHNARSALDHLVCALARENGAVSVRENAFPIFLKAPDEARLKKMRSKQLGGLTALDRKRIERMQPYKKPSAARSKRLATLGTLDNLDKHQIVTPAQLAPRKSAVGHEIVAVTDGEQNAKTTPNFKWPTRQTFAAPGVELWRVAEPWRIAEMPHVISLCFGDTRTAVQELREIHAEVVRIVADLT